jgi:hypothetical protein
MSKQGISNRESPHDEAQERKDFPPVEPADGKALDADEGGVDVTDDDSDFDDFDDDASDDEEDDIE